ncbi:hypothetical protein THAOC_29233, partial [Thalassiosira oceanica]
SSRDFTSLKSSSATPPAAAANGYTREWPAGLSGKRTHPYGRSPARALRAQLEDKGPGGSAPPSPLRFSLELFGGARLAGGRALVFSGKPHPPAAAHNGNNRHAQPNHQPPTTLSLSGRRRLAHVFMPDAAAALVDAADLGAARNLRQQLMASGHERPEGDACPICFDLIEFPMNKHAKRNACCMKRVCNGCVLAAHQRRTARNAEG